MEKKIFGFLVAAIVLVLFSGCATGPSVKDVEIQGLKSQVQELEAQVEEKDNLIESLKASSASARSGTTVSKPNTKQVQTALANAGYNPGPIDGKMGKRTRQGIRDFQKDKGLMVDGKVGKQTWAALGKYLN